MQLIAMAMPKGDKWKQKNKNRHQARSNDDSAENTSSLADQSQDGSDTSDTGNIPSATDCLLPASINTIVQNIPNLNVNLTERADHTPITNSLYTPVLPVADSLESVTVAHSISLISEVSTESILQQQDIECVDSKSDDSLDRSERKFMRTHAGTRCCSHRYEDVGSSSVLEQDIDLFSLPDVANIELLSIKVEPTPLEAGSLEVDNNMNLTEVHNMNLTEVHNETLAHLQPQSLVDWFKLLPHADVLTSPEKSRGGRTMSENGNDDSREDCASCNVITSAEQFFSINGTQVCRQTDNEYHNAHYCDLSQRSASEANIDYVNSDRNNFSRRDALLEPQRPEHVPSFSWHESDYRLWAKIEPPLWTSLALRENINCPEVARISQQSSPLCELDLGNFIFQPCMLSSVPNGGSSGRVYETEIEAPARCDTLGEGGVLANYVFQNCGLENAENISSLDVDGFDVDNEINSDEESFSGIKNNFSVTLTGLDCITRMLPSLVRDMILNQLPDEEVTMFMSLHGNDDEDEEIETYDFVEVNTDERRPTNPVACILDDGGNEHFLPILHNVPGETNDVDKDE